MKAVLSGSICLLTIAAMLSSCQTIPEAPLALDAYLRDLETRPPAPQPVLDYARALTEDAPDSTETLDTEDGITLEEASAIALWYNTDLRIARLELQRADAQASLAGRLQDPEVSLSGGKKRVESEAADTEGARPPIDIERSWISAASLSITIPLSGRLGAERRARAREADTARLAVEELEWETLRNLKLAWIHWSATLERRQLLEEHLILVDQFQAIAQALVQAGELEPGGARMLFIDRAQKEALRAQVDMEATERRVEILHMLGLLPDAPLQLRPTLHFRAEDPSPPAADNQWALEHPAVARLKSAYDGAEARLRLELKKQYPDITFSPAYDDEDDETAITLGLGFPVPVWNANRAGIADAASARDIARARAESMLHNVLADFARAQARHAGASARREHLVSEAGSAVDKQMSEAQALLRIGEADPSLLFQALDQAISIKLEILEAREAEQAASAQAAALLSPRISFQSPSEPQP